MAQAASNVEVFPAEALEWPPRLSLETEPVLKLFTGESFYSSADAAIREAVLNAIDAVTRRSIAEPTVEQDIRIIFDKEKLTLTISDNGDGMSRDNLSNLFSKIGASASRLVKGGPTSAIGEFGIGALSYFLVCDRYHVQTLQQGGEALALEFSNQMLDGRTRASPIEATRTEVGTTLIMFLKDQQILDLLVAKFPHWVRNVPGLKAMLNDQEIAQGGLTRKVRQIDATSLPAWIEAANIGPPEQLTTWDSYDGKGKIDVLYRGVFVERVEVDGLWGLEGAIHVDPKHFRPKLNREGFVGQDLKQQVVPFLNHNHPAILQEAVKCIHELLDSADAWDFDKAITLWLAVPRNRNYAAAAAAWDAEFRARKTIRLFGPIGSREISVAELVELRAPRVYLAPDQLPQAQDVVKQAVRVLQAKNEVVVQGLLRRDGYLSTVSVNSGSTSWLLQHAFKSDLPTVTQVADVAESLIRQDSVADVFTAGPPVKLVRLGNDSAPIAAISREIWINIDAPQGCAIVEEICKRNEGHLSLWVACMMHVPEHGDRLNAIGALLRDKKVSVQRLGLVRRQYLRGLIG